MDPQTLARLLLANGQQPALDAPGPFLPWTYNDTQTPEQSLRSEDNPEIPTVNKLHNHQFSMERNLADPTLLQTMRGMPLLGWRI